MQNEPVFIGVDISKDTLDVCILGQTRQYRIANNRPAIRMFFQRFEADHGRMHLCMENTGGYSQPLLRELALSEIALYVVAPIQIKRSQGLVRGKDDAIDARRIAEYLRKNHEELRRYTPHKEIVHEMRLVFSTRCQLAKDRRRAICRLKELQFYGDTSASIEMQAMIRQQIAVFDAQIRATEKLLQSLIDSGDELRQIARYLRSVTGIGKILSLRHSSSRLQALPPLKTRAPLPAMQGLSPLLTSRVPASTLASMSHSTPTRC